jgi:hypothetical protein
MIFSNCFEGFPTLSLFAAIIYGGFSFLLDYFLFFLALVTVQFGAVLAVSGFFGV